MKKRAFFLSVAVILVLAIIAGASLAYFSSEDEAENVIKMGNAQGIGVDISLDEAKVSYKDATHTWEVDDPDDRVQENTYGEEYAVYPGAYLPKDPTVHNDGANDTWLRLCVSCTNDAYITLFGKDAPLADKDAVNQDVIANLFAGYDKSKWSLAVTGGEAVDGSATGETTPVVLVFTLNEPFKIGEDAKLFDAITMPVWMTNYETAEGTGTFFMNMLDQGGVFDLDIVAQAVQYDGFASAKEAFDATFDAD